MCGIVGYFSFSKERRIGKHELFAMTQAMFHRGPDDGGCVLVDRADGKSCAFKEEEENTDIQIGDVGLGHRRLSILDLSEQGHQPMQAMDAKVWMVFNGEIYNYIELRKELEARGYIFHSTSDSEVALKSYLEWGTGCFEKFNGMWGIAFYDGRTDTLILSRDRFGKKPLYYFKDNSMLIFASEIKAIFKYPMMRKQINPVKVINYAGRHYRFVDNDEESFFKDIFQVPKSSFMEIRGDGKGTCVKYWKLKNDTLIQGSAPEKEVVETFKNLLESAVLIRLRSDVPIGCLLSGGMDSTSITCLAAQHNKDFTAFSGVTGTGYYDETEYIKEVIQKSGVKSKFIYPKPASLFSTLREMIAYHDEPVCTITWYSMYLMTRQVAEHGIKVLLTGHGGDELLAGYWDHYHYHFGDIRKAGGDDTGECTAWFANHKRDPEEYIREQGYLEKLNSNKMIEVEKFSQYLHAVSPALMHHSRIPETDSLFQGYLSRRLYLELFYETIPPSLRAEDRNCMAYSIENRVPFLDYRLAELCFRLGNEYKIRNGLGKWLLREAMKGILPDKVRCRKDKAGHNVPADEWFRNENKQEIEELMERKSFVNENIYDVNVVRKLFHEHLHGANHYMFFWQYINLNMWFELNFS